MDNLRELLKISEDRLTEVNDLLTDPDNETVGQIVTIVEKYGGPQEINRKAAEAGKFENLMTRLKEDQFTLCRRGRVAGGTARQGSVCLHGRLLRSNFR